MTKNRAYKILDELQFYGRWESKVHLIHHVGQVDDNGRFINAFFHREDGERFFKLNLVSKQAEAGYSFYLKDIDELRFIDMLDKCFNIEINPDHWSGAKYIKSHSFHKLTLMKEELRNRKLKLLTNE